MLVDVLLRRFEIGSLSNIRIYYMFDDAGLHSNSSKVIKGLKIKSRCLTVHMQLAKTSNDDEPSGLRQAPPPSQKNNLLHSRVA